MINHYKFFNNFFEFFNTFWLAILRTSQSVPKKARFKATPDKIRGEKKFFSFREVVVLKCLLIIFVLLFCIFVIFVMINHGLPELLELLELFTICKKSSLETICAICCISFISTSKLKFYSMENRLYQK